MDIITTAYDYFYQYFLGHIHFQTLAILFSLMITVAGFNELGFIDAISDAIVNKLKSRKSLILFLVLITSATAMLMTNDVALVVIVPFTIMLFHKSGMNSALVFTIVLETIAANLGGMITPIGNPHNVYMYQKCNMELSVFFKAILPYSIVAILMLVLLILIKPQEKGSINYEKTQTLRKIKYKKLKTIMYPILFLLGILSVLKVVNIYIAFLIIVTCCVALNYRLLLDVNYSLLLKFIILFVVIGNIASIPWIKDTLNTVVEGNEFYLGIGLSQLISNLPATLVLADFTKNGTELMVATDIGCLGTLIASMASLISFDYYTKTTGAVKKKYILTFTFYNIAFLIVMILIHGLYNGF